MAEDKNAFHKVIEAAGTGQRYPVMSLVRNDPGLAAALSKMVTSQNPIQYDGSGNREAAPPATYAFKNTSERIAQNVSDAKTVLQILPDMELAAQILVSSILAPKDMVTTELTFYLTDGLIAPEVTAALVDRTALYFEQDYKIKPLLPKMLRDMLFETGSYSAAVIPENSIDEIINGDQRITLESLSESIGKDGAVKPLGLLGPAIKRRPSIERSNAGVSMEAFSDYVPDLSDAGKVTFESIFQTPVDTFLSVTDNHNLLKIPQINQKIREQRIKGALGSKALESISTDKMNDRIMSGKIYKDRQFNFKPISTLKTQEQLNRKTVGNPLILHLPSEAVIPVYVPGCVEEQIGFFVLIDADGNPVSKAADADYYQQLSSRLNSNGSFPSAMLTRVKSQMGGFTSNNKEHMDYTVKAYGDMIEQDLLARLRNGVYGNGVALAKNEEIYRIMLARTLAKQHTQLLFIPVELMTYFAFKYTNDGIGQSLLDDMKILNSLRSMLLFANVMASLKNSIGRTEVKIKLDETDPNPQKTIEVTMHELIRTRQQYFPLGMNSPTDLTDWLQKSGFEFTFEGHPGLPDVSVDFGEKNSNYVKPDTDLEENLRKRAIMACGLSPETVDATFQAEFATSVVTNNILLSKRVVQTQELFAPQLSSHLRKCVMNSEVLVNDLREILVSNFDKLKLEVTKEGKETLTKITDGTADKDTKENSEAEKNLIVNKFLNEFIMNFAVKLPAPNSVTLEAQLIAMETYTKALDAALEAWISDKFFTADNGGQIASQVSTMKEVIKAYYLRKWMAENGVMTELADLTTLSYDGKASVDMFQNQEDHLASLTKSLTKFMVDINKVKLASDKAIEKIGGAGEGQPSSEQPSESGENPDEFPEAPTLDDVPSLDEPAAGGEAASTTGGDETTVDGTKKEDVKPEDKPKDDDVVV